MSGADRMGTMTAMRSATRRAMLTLAAAAGLILALLGIVSSLTGDSDPGRAPPVEVRIGESATVTPPGSLPAAPLPAPAPHTPLPSDPVPTQAPAPPARAPAQPVPEPTRTRPGPITRTVAPPPRVEVIPPPPVFDENDDDDDDDDGGGDDDD